MVIIRREDRTVTERVFLIVVTNGWWWRWIFLGTDDEAQEAELTAKEDLARFA
jgi:hypothetical protein